MQLFKKLNFQLTIIICVYLLYLVMLGYDIATTLFIILLLCTFYIVSEKQKLKSASWLKIILYAVLAYKLFYFIAGIPMSIHIIRLWNSDDTILQLAHRIYIDYFWDILMIGILAFVLIFNKQAQGNSWLKKLIGRFR